MEDKVAEAKLGNPLCVKRIFVRDATKTSIVAMENLKNIDASTSIELPPSLEI